MATHNPNMETNIEIAPYDTIAHFDRVRERIDKTFNVLINQLIARKGALYQIVEQVQQDFHSNESARRVAIRELDQTQRQLRQMNSNINLSAHEEARLVYEQFKEKLYVPTPLPNLSFSCPTLSLLQSQIEQFGEVVQLKALHYSEKKEPILTAGKKGKGVKELDGRGLSLDEVNEKVYIADTINHRVQVLSFQGEFLSHFGEEVLSLPWGISVSDYIFVTDFGNHMLFQFCKNSHQLLNRAGVEGRNEGQLSNPLGLSVDWNGDVFVTDQWNHRVSVFSNLLHYKQTIGQGSLSYPRDVKLTPDKVVVLDDSPNCIHFFSRSGDLLTSCVSQGVGQECLVCQPSFFCLDSEQNIIVSDYSYHEIKILSNSGELLHTIGRKGKRKGEFIHPLGVAISKFGILFVLSSNPNYCLQLF